MSERSFRRYSTRYEADVPEPEIRAALDAAKDDGGEALMGTLAEKWMEQGKAEGLAAGEALGHEKGKTEGKAEGLAEGEAKALTRLLTLRFGSLPASVTEQIASAPVTEVERWTDRVLEAATLEAVFADT